MITDEQVVECIENILKLLQPIKDAYEKKKTDPSLPLAKEHICFERGHTMFKVFERDNGRSNFGENKCSRCGFTEC